jgi:putative hydrolase of the HAD superfamily
MNRKFDAVAFDLDGTLYPNYQLNIRILPFVLKEHRLLMAMRSARNLLHHLGEAEPSGEDFYAAQARIIAADLGEEAGAVQARIERLIYRGWEPLFTRIRTFRYVKETLDALRDGGLKLGVLSDFPPEQKLLNLGLGGYWEAVLCSEVTGRLKPDPLPFISLAEALGTDADRILYVGNSVSYDIVGAKRAGMKAALVTSPWTSRRSRGNADFTFSDYRQLSLYVLR